jgi:hypothetical protein
VTQDAQSDDAAREAEHERAEARGAELRSELAATDARRAEEDTAKAHEASEAAQEEEEKLSRKERKAQEKAEAAQRQADRARAEADEAERRRREQATTSSVSGASIASPPSGQGEALTDRPEVLVGAAFAGAFILARVLKRLVD